MLRTSAPVFMAGTSLHVALVSGDAGLTEPGRSGSVLCGVSEEFGKYRRWSFSKHSVDQPHEALLSQDFSVGRAVIADLPPC